MGDSGRDIPVLLRSLERDRGMERIIESVNHIVGSAGVVVVLFEQFQCQRTRNHVHSLAVVA